MKIIWLDVYYDLCIHGNCNYQWLEVIYLMVADAGSQQTWFASQWILMIFLLAGQGRKKLHWWQGNTKKINGNSVWKSISKWVWSKLEIFKFTLAKVRKGVWQISEYIYMQTSKYCTRPTKNQHIQTQRIKNLIQLSCLSSLSVCLSCCGLSNLLSFP